MGLSHERMKIREAAASFVSKEYRRNYQEHGAITKKQGIEKAVKILNGIRTFRFGEYSVDDLEWASPTAWVELGDGRGIFEIFPKDFIPSLTFERIYNSRNAHLHNGTKNSHILLGVF